MKLFNKSYPKIKLIQISKIVYVERYIIFLVSWNSVFFFSKVSAFSCCFAVLGSFKLNLLFLFFINYSEVIIMPIGDIYMLTRAETS